MLVTRTVAELRAALAQARREDKSIGFVPTMGALHAGHFALVDAARRDCDLVVVSIFVNPTQFGPGEDFERYPRPLQRDLAGCEEHRVDVVFVPDAQEMYPQGFDTEVRVRGLSEILEGAHRPGHFTGVCTIVLKLLNCVRPHRAYFGQKDYQQLVVVRKMVRDLNLLVDIVAVPTVRDADGLALSSRNVYLSPEERARALAIPRGLRAAAQAWEAGERKPESLCRLVRGELDKAALVVDYVAAVHPNTLEQAPEGCRQCVVLVAARVGSTRLIDNLILSDEGVSDDA